MRRRRPVYSRLKRISMYSQLLRSSFNELAMHRSTGSSCRRQKPRYKPLCPKARSSFFEEHRSSRSHSIRPSIKGIISRKRKRNLIESRKFSPPMSVVEHKWPGPIYVYKALPSRSGKCSKSKETNKITEKSSQCTFSFSSKYFRAILVREVSTWQSNTAKWN